METKEYWAAEYSKQRRERLANAVADYLTCDKTSARQCYEEILAEIEETIAYYRSNMEKAKTLKAFLLGNSDSTADLGQPQFIQETKIPSRY